MNKDVYFSCSALPEVNGHALRAMTPDSDGAYDCIVGAVGVPTRANVIYDTESLVSAMSDPTSRFNICLKDSNLAGEYGHPDLHGKNDLDRLSRIEEKNISHYFTKIWIGDDVTVGGMTGKLIRAKVVPTGPYGDTLRKQLEDPHHNTAFSIRSICMPMTGPDNRYEYRRVEMVVTFDAVFAPGFEVATKRYVPSTESFSEIKVSQNDLMKVINTHSEGCEADIMLSRQSVFKIFGTDRLYSCLGQQYRKSTRYNELYSERHGSIPAAALCYR